MTGFAEAPTEPEILESSVLEVPLHTRGDDAHAQLIFTREMNRLHPEASVTAPYGECPIMHVSGRAAVRFLLEKPLLIVDKKNMKLVENPFRSQEEGGEEI